MQNYYLEKDKEYLCSITPEEYTFLEKVLTQHQRPVHVKFRDELIKTASLEVRVRKDLTENNESDAVMEAEKKHRDYVLQQIENAQQSNKVKIGAMWKNHIVPAYLLMHGFSNVLGKDWQKKKVSAEKRMEEGYLHMPKEKKEKIKGLLETYFTCFPKEVRVPKEEWDQYL